MHTGQSKSVEPLATSDESDLHRNAPTPDPACLYGLVGEVARAGSKGNESNPFAIARTSLPISHALSEGAPSCKLETRSITRGFLASMWVDRDVAEKATPSVGHQN